MKQIYDYLDYRRFLADTVEEMKRANRHFSYRFIAQRLGLKSSGFFLYVIQGKRKLPVAMAHKVAELLKMKPREHEYFVLLVNYAHAKSQKDQQFCFDQIVSKRKKQIRRIGSEELGFYEKWYYPVIREAVEILQIRDDYELLAESIIPPITPSQAKEAVGRLERLGLIRMGARGWYERAERIVTSGDQWESASIHNIQIQYADMGKEALDRIERKDRDISNLTISVSRKNFEKIREMIKNLRHDILEAARVDEGATEIYQCNFQLFPVLGRKGNREQ